MKVKSEKIPNSDKKSERTDHQCKIGIYGYEELELEVIMTQTSGRVDLPPSWIGKRVKIIRME